MVYKIKNKLTKRSMILIERSVHYKVPKDALISDLYIEFNDLMEKGLNVMVRHNDDYIFISPETYLKIKEKTQ